MNEEDFLRDTIFRVLVINKEKESDLLKLLERNNIEWQIYDTIPGCWCLNDDWYLFEVKKSDVQYGGVYPTDWSKEDIDLLKSLYFNRDIFILVYVCKNGEWIPIT